MSLKIEKKNTETLALIGRLDTVTAPELEAAISAILSTAESLVLDMEKLEYISSAGLRIILKTQKAVFVCSADRPVRFSKSWWSAANRPTTFTWKKSMFTICTP